MHRNTFFRNAVEAITSSLKIDEALHRCLMVLQGIIPADVMSVHLWEEGLGALRVAATSDLEKSWESNILVPIPEDHYDTAAWPEGDAVKFFNDFGDDPISVLVQDAIAPLYGKQEYSHMIMRVRIQKRRICDIVVMAKGKGRFTEKHTALLRMLQSIFGIAVSNSLRHRELTRIRDRLAEDNQILKDKLDNYAAPEIVGGDSGLRNVVQRIGQVSVTDAPVLLLGETGVGKDVIASALQAQSARKDKPFVRVNCGAIPETLLDSELFGHEKGAFTGANDMHKGRFERAHTGTIFLDEVGELSLRAQAKLLRVLQNGEIERVGAKEVRRVDVRVIAATNRNLESMVNKGTFRTDLFYRLNVFPITIPPLRHRRLDIPLLTEHIIGECSSNMNMMPPKLAPDAMVNLMNYVWPGNVRELANVIERAMIRNPQGPLEFTDILSPSPVEAPSSFVVLPDIPIPLDEMNRMYIEKVLAAANGKIHGKDGAADLLKVNPHTLRSRMDKLGINFRKKSQE